MHIFSVIIKRVLNDAEKRGRNMNPRIVSDINICGGEPCIKNTRIPVHIVLSHLAAGEDYVGILKHFPRLTREDILACLEYASFLATEKMTPA